MVHAGSDLDGISTSAEAVQGGYVINGQKTWVTSAPVADFFTVFAKAGKERKLTIFLVERGFDGLVIGRAIEKMGVWALPTAEVAFRDCFVPATHRLCAEAIFEAVRRVRADGGLFDVWLYRGAWEEWEPHEIEMAVPLGPETLERKKQAIFRHQSQKDKAMFPGGTDRREFWQRAEDRNLDTARTYDALGLPEYFALEAFVKWKE